VAVVVLQTSRRVLPTLSTYAKLRRELGLEVPPSALVPPVRHAEPDLLKDHLTALAACVLTHRGAPLADLARALGVSIPGVREGILRIADRLAAVGFRVVEMTSTCASSWSRRRPARSMSSGPWSPRPS